MRLIAVSAVVPAAAGENTVDFMVHGLVRFHLAGQELWFTTTHVSLLIVIVGLLVFALMVRRRLKRPEELPGNLQNLAELMVEKLDGMILRNMGEKGKGYRNCISALFLFLLVCNLSGVLGIRPPTADFGVTLPLGLLSFAIIQYNNVRWNHSGAAKALFEPFFIFFPINLIGEAAVPFSLSLRLFGNVMSGTVMMALIYGLLTKVAIGWPGLLQLYFDVFSGCIQAYVFCMLTMVLTKNKMGEG